MRGREEAAESGRGKNMSGFHGDKERRLLKVQGLPGIYKLSLREQILALGGLI